MSNKFQIVQVQADGDHVIIHPESQADIIEYDNAESNLAATTVQEALDELTEMASSSGVTGVKGSAEAEYRRGNVNITKAHIGLNAVTNDAQVKRSEMGAINGVATLDSSGKVPSAQLPGYVDDVLEYDSKSAFPATGDSGKIYVALDDNKTWRWSGSTYVEISTSLALGETSTTAYAGDKGKQNATDIATLKGYFTNGTANGAAKVKNSLKFGSKTYNGSSEQTITADDLGALTKNQKITLSGDVNGEGETTIAVSLANVGTAGIYSVVTTDEKGRVTAGGNIIEVGVVANGTPSDKLAVGGIFFKYLGE